MVTGFATAAVQLAVTCVVGEVESWTDGSLAVQLELARAAVAVAGQPGPVAEATEALKVALLAGAAAVWFTVAVVGPTFSPVAAPQLGILLPQPIISRSAALSPALAKNRLAKNLDVNIAYTPCLCSKIL
jgi:hypothetical protein